MYLSTIDRPAASGARAGRRWAGLGVNVFALGTVSLITDVSSEMVTAVLPVYLVIGLGLGPLAFGLVDGLYAGATAILRLVGGWVADRSQRRKPVAGLGYALSAVAKLGLLAAGPQAAAIGAVIAVDRTGKGLRTAPRDALISLSTPEPLLGRAFGVHRMMDSIGAFLGPLLALGVLTATATAFDAVFVVSFCVAALGVLVLVLFVKEHREPQAVTRPRARAAVALLRSHKRLVAAAAVLGLATIGDGFVYLLLQQRASLAVGWFPLLAVGTNLAYLLLAGPLGMLADRIGRLPVVLAGYASLAIVYLLLFGPLAGLPLIGIALTLNGLFYACTDGVLMALAGPLLPVALRTTGLAFVQTGQSLAYLGSSVLFGLAWQTLGAPAATRLAALAALLAVAVTVAAFRRPRAH